MWVVADGMGGHDAGEVASAMVVEALSQCRPESSGHSDARDALAALADVNARLVEMAKSGFDSRTIGSTVVGLVADDDAFTCFWAGDSRAYLIRDGAMTRITRDHSLVQDLLDAGMIDEAEAEVHPNANIITRAVGAADRLQAETVTGKVLPGDIFLLASDGLTRIIGDDELLSGLNGGDLETSADRLLQLALDRDAPDNVSLIIVRAGSTTTEPGDGSHMVLQHGHNRNQQ